MSNRGTRRRHSPTGSVAFSIAARYLLGAVVIGSVLAIGTVHVPVLLVVAVVAALALAAMILGGRMPRPLPRVAWLLIGLSLFTLWQSLPLPLPLLARAIPRNAETWADAFVPFAEGAPALASISLDPGASLVEALKLWTYLAVFLCAFAVGSRRGAVWGALLLGGSALLLALISLAHTAVDATRVFGIYAPRFGGRGLRIAPLIDPNNLAGYLNFGTLCALSLLAMARPPLPRWVLGLAIAPMVSVSLLTGSRGGLLSLVAGVVILTWLMRRASRGLAIPVNWRALGGAVGASLFLATLFMLAATGARLRHLLLDDNLSKLSVAAASLPMIRDHWLFGVGRGAFESTFAAYHVGIDNGVYSHPENFLVQWLSEWGLPCTLAVCATGCWLLRPRRWGVARSLPACGLFVAVCSLALQNLVDLSFELPGVAIAVWAAIGFGLGHADDDAKSSLRVVPTLALLGGGAALVGLVATKGMHTLAIDRDRAQAEMPTRRDPSEWQRFRAVLRAIVERHPAEPYFYRLGAIAAWRTGQAPMPWLQSSLQRGINAGRTHFLLGSYLATLGKESQASLELRLALTSDPQLATRAAKRALAMTRNHEELLRIVPEGEAGASVLLALAEQLRDSNCQEGLEMLRESTRRYPQLASSRFILTRWLLAAAGKPELSCGESTTVTLLAEAMKQLDVGAKLEPNAPELPLLRARALIAGGRAADAVQLLRGVCPSVEKRSECVNVWIEATVLARDEKALSELTPLALAEGCTTSAGCGKVQWALGEAAAALGARRTALKFFEDAAVADPSARRWRLVARAATSLGELGRAQRALDNAAAMAPLDKAIRSEIDGLRRKALLAAPTPQ